MRDASFIASPHIMRDEDGGLAELRAQAQKFLLQVESGDRIERAEWLVEEQNLRVGRQRPRHTDTLALTAGKLMRQPLREILGGQTHAIEQFRHARIDLARSAIAPGTATSPTLRPTVKCGNRPPSWIT